MTRAVVHLDMDCFYAQVEAVARGCDPSQPLAVRQKGILVTCNYAARAKGLRKLMPAHEGLRLCPELRVVPGEDLRPYRRASDRIASLLRGLAKGCPVEKLGFDENFVDVTDAVDAVDEASPRVEGHRFCSGEERPPCDCPSGTHERLAAASRLAADFRRRIKAELGYTCCAGVGPNKTVAKLAGALHKPDQQTTVFPCDAAAFMGTLQSVRAVPGVGAKTADALRRLDVESVLSLQECRAAVLEKTFGADVAGRLKRLSLGVDDARVKPSPVRPLALGLEDTFKTIDVVDEVRAKFETLLDRLIALAEEDGRQPGGIKVTLRQVSGARAAPHRETRQGNLPGCLFARGGGRLVPAEGARDKLMNIVMRLFHKSVDLKRPFRLTLLGLAFTKFREFKTGRGSIASFLIDDVSVQSAISLRNETDADSVHSASSPMSVSAPEASDDEVGPSPKKPKRSLCSSPNRLRVAELNLNTPEKEQAGTAPMNVDEAETSTNGEGEWDLPPDVDRDVFLALPTTMQEELRLSWKCSITQTSSCRRQPRKEQHNTISRYFIQNK